MAVYRRRGIAINMESYKIWCEITDKAVVTLVGEAGSKRAERINNRATPIEVEVKQVE
jgi:hypothetical protein